MTSLYTLLPPFLHSRGRAQDASRHTTDAAGRPHAISLLRLSVWKKGKVFSLLTSSLLSFLLEPLSYLSCELIYYSLVQLQNLHNFLFTYGYPILWKDHSHFGSCTRNQIFLARLLPLFISYP